jgi:hypothetical protein
MGYVYINDEAHRSRVTGEIEPYITKNGVPVETNNIHECLGGKATPAPPELDITTNIPGLE